MKEARRLAETALAEGGDAAALNAFLGMVHVRSGNPSGAIKHLTAAHVSQPGDVTIACNLISALIETGDLAGALQVATEERALSDGSLRIARYRGFLAQSLERFDEAIAAYEHVLAKAPNDFESWNNLGNARSAVADLPGSVAALQRAVELDPGAAPARLNLAAALYAAGDNEKGEAVLRKASDDFPSDARALYQLYVQMKREARQDEALAALEGAVARDPDDADLQLKLGVECGIARRTADAEGAFRRAIALHPAFADAYLGLAIQYEHTNREEKFGELIDEARAAGVDSGVIAFIEAMEHRRAKRFDEGLRILSSVPAAIEPERTPHLRATLLDRLERSDEAFASFSEANARHAQSPTEPLRRAAELRESIHAEVMALTPEWARSWSPDKSLEEGREPVFLVGFPRSGTTLLDTILMGHPHTVVLEEEPALNHVDKSLGGMFELPKLGEKGIVAAREEYFSQVAKVADVPTSALLIDKSPLFLYKVPLIKRLFPTAKFILALRHPCDVLLSCFMSNFRLNSAMCNFLRLEDAAEFYDLVFQHWERSIALFEPDVHTIVYERLVDNVEEEVRPLFDFLGLDWHEAALDHRRTAKARGLITTASYSQVTEPIYKRAAGRWERYRGHLEPILPTLEPWVKKFGYSL